MNTTVIIPNYNGIGYLKDCIKSLYSSGDKDLKIIVVDDGSTDGS
ncbi:MAG: glycosyltransferase family 2 protein, partial [Lachnospiraceae bacterium]|nr:glycosyltransferase family 2 protein [Lachnospiraceae bacterium]